MIQAIRRAMTLCLEGVGRLVGRLWSSPIDFCYFPQFVAVDDWADQYYRACWYLPFHPAACRQVAMIVPDDCDRVSAATKPDYFGEIPAPASHIQCHSGFGAMLKHLLRAKTLLIWKIEGQGIGEPLVIRGMRWLGKSVVYVDRHRKINGRGYVFNEYINYSSLLWKALPAPIKAQIIQENREGFRAFADTLEGYSRTGDGGLKPAYIFGNGPTLVQVADFPEFDGIRVACNTIVANKALLDRISPHFIAAVDPESHLGPSRYAHQFRQDLKDALARGNCQAIMPLSQAFPWLIHEPELAEQFCFVPMGEGLTFNLREDFHLPALFGVLSCAMLPVAATFSREITLLGFDGIVPGSHERKSWEYAPGTQYWDLLKYRFRCHPSLRLSAPGECYQWHQTAVQQTVAQGERVYGIQYRSLTPTSLLLHPPLLPETLQQGQTEPDNG